MKHTPKTPCPTPCEPEAMQHELAYLRRLSEQTVARILSLDALSIAGRHELEQKRRGFSLMAELAVNLGRDSDYNSIFISVSRRINAALNMQRTAVLVPESDGTFSPAVLQGYPVEEQKLIEDRSIYVSSELLQQHPVLVTGADAPSRLASFREAIALPYFISAPVILHGEVAALLVTGRLAEKFPFLTRLGQSDVETVQTVSAYLAAMLAASRLVEAEERTQIMLDATPMCCNFWDEHFNNVACNQEAVRLFGLKDKQEYLARFTELSPEFQPNGRHSLELVKEKIKEAFSTGWLRFEWMHQKPNGEPIPVEITLVRVRRAEGFNVAGYTRDLRAHKAMLAEMREAENELRTARDIAEKSAKAKSEFLANMSHEIRTPMNAVLGMLHLLDGTELNEKQRRWLGQAEHSATLLLHIINDILDFSKIEAGRLEVEHISFSLFELLDNIHALIRKQSEDKGLKLFIHHEAGVPDKLVGDPLRLEQVLLNLTNNAVKFTQAGSIVVHVALKELRGASATLLFEVKDTGIGLSPLQVANLFTPFSQADTSTTRKYGGTGLGLAISQSLVELMDGKIWCESELGEGSKFSFTATFGLASEHAPSALHNHTGEAALDADAPLDLGALKGMRVLLAEDNPINQIIAIELLSGKGVEVKAAGTGKEAIEALEKESFDLVLMDIQMPEMDGLAATAHIRANPAYADLPIVAMTAHAMAGDREISIGSGMNDHLTKPIDPQLLYKALLRWGKRG